MRARSAVERALDLHVLPIEAPTEWVCSARTAKGPRRSRPRRGPVLSTRGNAAKCDGAGSTRTVETSDELRNADCGGSWRGCLTEGKLAMVVVSGQGTGTEGTGEMHFFRDWQRSKNCRWLWGTERWWYKCAVVQYIPASGVVLVSRGSYRPSTDAPIGWQPPPGTSTSSEAKLNAIRLGFGRSLRTGFWGTDWILGRPEFRSKSCMRRSDSIDVVAGAAPNLTPNILCTKSIPYIRCT